MTALATEIVEPGSGRGDGSDQIVYRVAEALRVFPVSQTTLYELMKSGEIESFHVGRARLIPRQALLDYMARRLAAEQAARASTGVEESPP